MSCLAVQDSQVLAYEGLIPRLLGLYGERKRLLPLLSRLPEPARRPRDVSDVHQRDKHPRTVVELLRERIALLEESSRLLQLRRIVSDQRALVQDPRERYFVAEIPRGILAQREPYVALCVKSA